MPVARLWPDARVKPRYGAAQIDRGHPLGAKLYAALVMNEGGGLPRWSGRIAGTPSATVGSPAWTAGHRGLQTGYASTVIGYGDCDPIPVGSGRFTVVTSIRPSSLTATAGVIQKGTNVASAGAWSLGLSFNLSANWAAIVNGATGGTFANFYEFAMTGVLQTTRLQQIATDYDTTRGAGARWAAYVDGAAVAAVTVTTEGTGTVPALSLPVEVGRANNSTLYFGGDMEFIYVFAPGLSAGEIRWLVAEPYAVFQPIVRRRWFLPVGGTLFTTSQAVVTAGAILLVKQPAIGRALVATGVVALSKLMQRLLAVTATGVVAVLKGPMLTRAVVAVGAVTRATTRTVAVVGTVVATAVVGVVKLPMLVRTIITTGVVTGTGIKLSIVIRAVVAVGAVAVGKMPLLVRAALATGVVGFVRLPQLVRAAVALGSVQALASKLAFVLRAVVTTGVVTGAGIKLALVVRAVVTTGVVTVAKLPMLVRGVLATGVVAGARMTIYGVVRAVTSLGTVGLQMQTRHAMAVVATGVVGRATAAVFLLTRAVVAVGVVGRTVRVVFIAATQAVLAHGVVALVSAIKIATSGLMMWFHYWFKGSK